MVGLSGRRYRTRLIVVLFLALFAPLALAALPPRVVQALAEAGVPEDAVAVVVQPVGADTPVLAHRHENAMNPASVMKLVTAYAALEILGPAYFWRTEALSDAPVADGPLKGNLYIKGYGDPQLTFERFWRFLKRVRAAGVTQIAGDVVIDTSYFAPARHDPAEFDGQPLRAYNVGPSALLVNFNTIEFGLSADPDTQRVRLTWEPPLRGLQVVNRVTADDAPCAAWRERLGKPVITGDGRRLVIEFAGRYSTDCGARVYPLALFAQQDYVATLFAELWREMGGKIGGRVRPGVTPPGATLLATIESPPLAAQIRDMNKWSNNAMARQLYLTLGAETLGPPATAEKSFAAVQRWLVVKGFKFPELAIENGSGLSRRERISARHLADLLLAAWKSPLMPELIASLPLSGIDGTLRSRAKAAEYLGRAHIKTGSLDDVRAMAGYLLDRNGRMVAVAAMINHPRAQAARPAEEALLEWVYGTGE